MSNNSRETIKQLLDTASKITKGEWVAAEAATGDLFISTKETGQYIAEIGSPEDDSAEADHQFMAQAANAVPDIRELPALMLYLGETLRKVEDALESFPDLHEGRGVKPEHILQEVQIWEANNFLNGLAADISRGLAFYHPWVQELEKK